MTHNQRFGRDLTSGSIPRHIANLAIPMLIGNVLHTGYSIIDMMWIGHFAGKEAMGAIAVSFPILFMLIAIAAGATMATSILVSQYYGAKNDSMVDRTVKTSFSLSLLLSSVLIIIGLLLRKKILNMMDTPAVVVPLASDYLRIMLYAFSFMFLSFLVTAVLRGIGDTKTPLIFVGIGVLSNALLDPLLIAGLGPFPALGLKGAAYASLISSGLALLIGLLYLNRKGHVVAINHRSFAIAKELIGPLFRIGFPSMIQQSLVSLGAAFVTSFVNAFGPSAIAAYGASSRIEALIFMPTLSFHRAVSALVGQNLGAGKIERVRDVFRWGLILSCAVTISLSILGLLFPAFVIRLFVSDPEVIALGKEYLQIVIPSYTLYSIMFVSHGVINGAGHTLVTMVLSIIALWVFRVPLAAWLSHSEFGLKGVWIAIAASPIISMVLSLGYYRSGRWKKPVTRPGLGLISK